MVRHHSKEEVSEISLVPANTRKSSDVYCSKCDYIGNIAVDANWAVYQNPNFNLILSKHKMYMKWLDLCPQAIEWVLREYIHLCCPKCHRTRLHISAESTYHPEWILCSMDCHVKRD